MMDTETQGGIRIMEETLGKRIAGHRKRLKLTQDQLADQLGVTAQAVSKWENDLSCPDIGILPRLSAIFGTSIDALLGCEPRENEIVRNAEVIRKEDPESEGIHIQKGQWELHIDNNKKDAIGIALWILLCGGVMLASRLMEADLGFWDCLWTTGLLIFGFYGLFPDLSIFRLGCALFAGYSLLEKMEITSFGLSGKLIFPACLLLFGLGLLADAIKKPRKSKFEVHNNHHEKFTSACNLDDTSFDCHTSFGENSFLIDLPQLARGKIDLSFGDLTVDLGGCEEITANCIVDVNCAFGEIQILVPKRWEVKTNAACTLGALNLKGQPDSIPQATILLNAHVSFGEVQVVYI